MSRVDMLCGVIDQRMVDARHPAVPAGAEAGGMILEGGRT
jgi:hypothetical protein